MGACPPFQGVLNPGLERHLAGNLDAGGGDGLVRDAEFAMSNSIATGSTRAPSFCFCGSKQTVGRFSEGPVSFFTCHVMRHMFTKNTDGFLGIRADR